MQVERNPYDPIEIKMPSFAQMMKAGAAFTIGAALVTIVGVVCWTIIGVGLLASVGRVLLH